MTAVYLDRPAGALGSTRRTVEDAEQAGDLISAAAALRDAGFSEHCICPEQEDAYELARSALQASAIDPSAVDCIVYATCLPANGNLAAPERFQESGDVKDLMVFPASRLQADFSMDRAFVIGLNQQACTGMLGSIRLARNLLVSEPDLSHVLCLTADRFPAGALYEQAYNLISDGAAVCQVSRHPQGYRVVACHHITNGALARASDDQTVGSYFNYVHRLVQETLAAAGLTMDDIHWVVPQNTNIKAWQVLSGLLGVRAEQAFFETMPTAGHVISADNILNLAALEDSGRVESGQRLITFMAGFGSNFQCLILERV